MAKDEHPVNDEGGAQDIGKWGYIYHIVVLLLFVTASLFFIFNPF